MKKYKKLNYIKKKETIKKKTRELSILCGIKACAILVGPNKEVDTWPENPTDLKTIIQSYKKSLINGKKKVKVNGDQSKESLLVKLNSKVAAVEKRIEFLKMVNNGNGVVDDVTGSSSSGKEVVLANQETHNSDFEFMGSVTINDDQLTSSRGKEVRVANQENYNSAFEFWENTVAINGDQLEDSTAYNQRREIVMADQETHNSVFEFWGSNSDQLRNCSTYDQCQGVDIFGHDGQLVVMPNEMNMWETLNNLDNVQNFGCDDLWPIVTGPEFDILPQEATDFGTLLNSLLANDPIISLEPNYDYSIPFSTDTF
ncbi:hypothetical protein K7X08_019921 [Anisodus acutangulus]|uniref:MADS-box domain-containing protein n=1 Tax=Anisodus acutangulus TaxID=402998 RepID=A0A9Q1MSU0_9SOLA|nr:hypothetical protein K7X08_019921 [Anisodus acutangulus]